MLYLVTHAHAHTPITEYAEELFGRHINEESVSKRNRSEKQLVLLHQKEIQR